MGMTQKFPVDFSPAIREIIKQQEGILGDSESDVIKNIVLFYFIEKGHLKQLKTKKAQVRDLIG